MPVHCVIAKIRFASDEPFREGRLTEITNCTERSLPMNRFGLFSPEAFALFQRAATELERSSGLTHWGEQAIGVKVASLQTTGVQELQNKKSLFLLDQQQPSKTTAVNSATPELLQLLTPETATPDS